MTTADADEKPTKKEQTNSDVLDHVKATADAAEKSVKKEKAPSNAPDTVVGTAEDSVVAIDEGKKASKKASNQLEVGAVMDDK